MEPNDALELIEEKRDIIKDSDGESFIYNVDGVDRYYTGWAILEDKLILYMRATEEEASKGREESVRLEWSKFLEIADTEEPATDQ